MNFDGSEKLLKEGSEGSILLYNGFVYKVYSNSQLCEYACTKHKYLFNLGVIKYNIEGPLDSKIIKMPYFSGIEYSDYICIHFDRFEQFLTSLFYFHDVKVDLKNLPQYLQTSQLTYKSIHEGLNKFHEISCICHRDLHFGNVIIDNDDIIVIDWTSACLYHPFADYFDIYLALKMKSPNLADFIKDELVKCYSKKYNLSLDIVFQMFDFMLKNSAKNRELNIL